MSLAATAAMVLAFSPQILAATDLELVLTANGASATIIVDTTGLLSLTCSGTLAHCGDLQTMAPTEGGSIWVETSSGTSFKTARLA